MSKLNAIKKELYENNYKIIVMKNNETIFTSMERGIKPIYDLQKHVNHELINNAYVADRVTGKAAAMILSYLNIKGIFTELISENAIEIFIENGIEVEYQTKVKNILNRSKNDLCPVEKISFNEMDVNILLINIKKFLKEL
ncbi:DUF1893 domain-containing protein [Clostridiaceae bacterium HSG29]|nr:DUF1893 domain-containing protein [Clostridiaceae bacterium HSG29]